MKSMFLSACTIGCILSVGAPLIAQTQNQNFSVINENSQVLSKHGSIQKEMRIMAETYIANLGKEFQTRAIEINLMGEGLLAQKNEQNSQEEGRRAIAIARQLYLLGQQMQEGKEVSPEDVKDYVNRWKLK